MRRERKAAATGARECHLQDPKTQRRVASLPEAAGTATRCRIKQLDGTTVWAAIAVSTSAAGTNGHAVALPTIASGAGVRRRLPSTAPPPGQRNRRGPQVVQERQVRGAMNSYRSAEYTNDRESRDRNGVQQHSKGLPALGQLARHETKL
jgi:hypothetical protein